jgi:hypothetical protein
MKPEVAAQIRSHLAHISALVDANVETKPSDTAPVVAAPGDGYINGHSLYADEDGFVQILAVNVFLATLPAAIRPKLPTRFALESAYRNSIFPSAIAREKCHRNLSARMRSPETLRPSFNLDAQIYTVTERKRPAQIDWNIPPEAQIVYQWQADLALQDGNRALAGNWNGDVYNADFFLLWVKDRAAAEMEAAGLKG